MSDNITSMAGQGLTAGKLKPAIERRINEIVILAKRRELAEKRGDVEELLKIADEYEYRQMFQTANIIRRGL